MEKSETFIKRAGTTDKGRDYENIVVAKIVLQLVNEDGIKDFHISSNDKKFGAFDDIVVKIESESGTKVKALQLKHSDRKILALDNLKSKKGDYSIHKYFESFQKLRNSVDEFILFTNRSFKVDDDTTFQLEEEEFSVKPVKVIDTVQLSKDVNHACQFQIVENISSVQNTSRFKEYEMFFNNFYLCSDQEDLHAFKNTTRTEFKQTYRTNDDKFMKFYRIVAEWMVQEGKKEKLNKHWMKGVIALQILSSQIEPLYFGAVNEKMTIFRECISMFDVTLFGKESCRIVQQLWGDVDTKNFDFVELNRIARKYQLSSCYIDENSIDKLNPRAFAQLLWLMKKCPLILHNDENIANIIQFCPNKNFILLGNSTTKKIQNCSVFQSLADLQRKSEMFEQVMENFVISIQGKREVNLVTAFENNFEILENVSTDRLLEMLNGPYYMGGRKETLPDPYIQRNLSRNVIDITYLEKKHKDTIIILNCEKSFDEIKEKLKTCQVIDVKRLIQKASIDMENPLHRETDIVNLNNKLDYYTFNFEKFDFINTVYFSNENIDDSELEEIFNKNKETKFLHYFKLLNDKCLEWVKSKGGVSSLEEYKITNTYFIVENALWSDQLSNNINLIVGDPGMGKSELMKNFKNTCYPKYWTIIINPRDCNSYFENSDFCKNINHTIAFQRFIVNEKCRSLNELERIFFHICVEKNNVVLIWDALDDILSQHIDTVSNLILHYSKKGFLQLVTSRQHLKTFLEKKLTVLSRGLNQFSEQEQVDYIKQRLASFISVDEINIIAQKIKSTFVLIQHVNILGIPLQIFMLTELFRRNNDKYLKLLEGTFLLTDLYHYFIEEIFYIFYKDKVDFDLTNPHLRIVMNKEKHKALKHYERFAFMVVFPEEITRRLNIDHRKHINKILKKYSTLGFVKQFQNGLPQFLHGSFAEYLVAAYLSRKFDDIPADVIFEERYDNVRFFFDMLVSNNSPAHIAVLYKKSLKEFDDETLTRKDMAGRSVLHLLCSWGQRHPRVATKYESGQYIVDENNSYNRKAETREYFDAVLYLLSKNDPDEHDTLLDLTALSYARKSESLGAELKLLETGSSKVDQSCTSCDRINILLYSIIHGYDEVCEIFTLQNTNSFSEEVRFVTENDSNTSLVLACRKDNLKIVKYLVESGGEIKKANNKGVTPLFTASKHGHEETVKYLVRSGAETDPTNNDGLTPLHLALMNGHKTIAEYLLEAGAEIDHANNDGMTPLHTASFYGLEKIVEYLVKAGAEIDHPNTNGLTPLHFASEQGREKVTQYLVEAGAEIDHTNNAGLTPLHIASMYGEADTVEVLIKAGAEIDRMNNCGCTPFYLASGSGHGNVVKRLEKAGAVIDHTNNDGMTPLSVAVLYGHEKVVEYLVKAGVEIDHKNKDGFTPLHIASTIGNEKIVEYLIKAGAGIDHITNAGMTPLHLASKHGDSKPVECLIQAGAEIDHVSSCGCTALHFASSHGHENIFKQLVKAGANIDQTNCGGRTPLYVAALSGHERIVEYAVKAGAEIDHTNNDGWTPLYAAAMSGHEKIAEYLVKAGAEIDHTNNDGWTPLYAAAMSGHEKIVEYLVKVGAEIEHANNNGFSPLFVAVLYGQEKTVEVLVKAGAEIDHENNDGFTPLHVASALTYENIFECLMNAATGIDHTNKDGLKPLHFAAHAGRAKFVERLVNAGAEIDHTNNFGMTALHGAAMEGHQEIVDYLVKAGAEIDRTNNNGMAPLHLAAQNGHEKVVEYLVKINAEIDQATQDGLTALHVACGNGSEKIVERLVNAGANINHMNNFGLTPIYVASLNGYEKIVEFLAKEGAEIDRIDNAGLTPLHLAAQTGHKKVVEYLVNMSVEIDRAVHDGSTALHMASRNGFEKTVQLLVEAGAQIDHTNNTGETPLHEAAVNGHEKVVECLVKAGASINCVNKCGRTPLYLASFNGHEETVKHLTKAGSEIDHSIDDESTSLHAASRNGYEKIVEDLVGAGSEIDHESNDGLTPLHLASVNKHEKIVDI